jgi:phosphoglucosamine mutase
MNQRKYFGTDGVRGKVGGEVINAEFALRLGYAAGKVLAKEHSARRGRPTVLIGKDTRISGYMLESALEAGFASAGIEVLLAGPLPTPAVAYLTRTWRLVAGIVISASHNPYFDNGIKFFSGDGMKLPAPSEVKNIAVARKSLVAARHIAEGAMFTEENLTTKRPGTGVSAMRYYEFLGRRASREYEADELIDAC